MSDRKKLRKHSKLMWQKNMVILFILALIFSSFGVIGAQVYANEEGDVEPSEQQIGEDPATMEDDEGTNDEDDEPDALDDEGISDEDEGTNDETEATDVEDDSADSVDKDTLLAKLIESDPKELDEASYTEASWKALQAAWKKAIDVFDYDATQDEVNEALADLTKAYNELTDAVVKQESDKPFVEDDICSEDSINMQITINLDQETDVCSSQEIEIADTVNLIVMPGDLPTNTTLTVTDVGESNIVTKAEGLHRAGSVLKFILKTPEGSQYTENFALKMSYANGVSSDDIYYYNEKTKEWDGQGAEYDYDDFTLNVELSHLSTYGVFGKDEKEAEDKLSKKVITVEGEDDDSNITDESSKEDDSSEIAISVEDDKDKKGGFLPSTATGIFNWILVGVVILVIGFTFFIINRKKSSKQR